MRRFFNGLDWKTITAVIALALVLASIWRMVEQHNELDDSNRQRDALIATLQQQQAQAAQDRATAAQDRATDSRNQQALLDYTKALADRQRALLAWLHAHGVTVPPRFLTVVKPPRIVTITAHPKHHQSRSHHHASGGSRTPKATATPTGPGESGTAPGHRRHHHKHRRH